MASSENLELAGLQFENHSTCDAQFLARSTPRFFREPANHGLGLGQRNILFEGVLGRYGLCRPVGNDFALVNSSSKFVEANAVATEATFECRHLPRAQLGD